MSPLWYCSGSQNKAQVTLSPAVTGKGGSPHHPCCSTGLKDTALAQMCQDCRVFFSPQLLPSISSGTGTIKACLLHTSCNPFSSGGTVQQVFTEPPQMGFHSNARAGDTQLHTWIPTGFLLPRVSECSAVKVQQWEGKGVQSVPCPPHLTGSEEPTTAPNCRSQPLGEILTRKNWASPWPDCCHPPPVLGALE